MLTATAIETELKEAIKEQNKPFVITLRGRRQPAIDGRRFEGQDLRDLFGQALAVSDYPAAEPVIDGPGVDDLAFLDVDYGVTDDWRPDEQDCFRAVNSLAIKPAHWWRTHGGGLRMVFFRCGKLTAAMCTTLAAYQLKDHSTFTRAEKWEVLRWSRHPYYERNGQVCGPVNHERAGGSPDRARAILLGDADPAVTADCDEVKEWLDERGLEAGKRFDHDHCPFAPSPSGKNQPVVLYENGIKCWKCGGRFIPWARLIGGEPAPLANPIRDMVRGMVHWLQAKHTIGEEYEKAYHGMLLLEHVRGEVTDEAKEELVKKVFFPPIKMILVDNQWVKADGSFEPIQDKTARDTYINQLPATLYVTEKEGKVETGSSPTAVADLKSYNGLAERGYRSITVHRGVDIADWARMDEDRGPVALIPANPPFKYRPPSERNMEWVRQHLERHFPGYHHNALRALIAAKGIRQRGDSAMIPRFILHGQSRGGKSALVRLAANLTGEKEAECEFAGDRERFVRGYADASLKSTYALFNEFAKKGLSGAELLSRALAFEFNLQFHAMYKGTASIVNPAVIALTDVDLPSVFRQQRQLGARYVIVDVGAGANATGDDWMKTCGCGLIENWRAACQENTLAADCLVSEVMDDFFPLYSRATFPEIVNALGLPLAKDEDTGEDDDLRELYDACQALPEEKEGWFAKRGDGCRTWPKGGGSKEEVRARALWNELTSNGEDKQRVCGANWTAITGVRGMRCTPLEHGARAGLRFWVPKRAAGQRQRIDRDCPADDLVVVPPEV